MSRRVRRYGTDSAAATPSVVGKSWLPCWTLLRSTLIPNLQRSYWTSSIRPMAEGAADSRIPKELPREGHCSWQSSRHPRNGWEVAVMTMTTSVAAMPSGTFVSLIGFGSCLRHYFAGIRDSAGRAAYCRPHSLVTRWHFVVVVVATALVGCNPGYWMTPRRKTCAVSYAFRPSLFWR